MMDMSMLNFQAALTRKGKTDKIVVHLDLYEKFKHILSEDRYHAAVLKCFDNLPSLQTYDVESTSAVFTEKVLSVQQVSLEMNSLQQILPEFLLFDRNDEQDKDQGPGLVGSICTDCQVMNSEHRCIDCNNFV